MSRGEPRWRASHDRRCRTRCRRLAPDRQQRPQQPRAGSPPRPSSGCSREIERLGFTPNVAAQQLRRRSRPAPSGSRSTPSGAAPVGHILDEFLVELTAAAPATTATWSPSRRNPTTSSRPTAHAGERPRRRLHPRRHPPRRPPAAAGCASTGVPFAAFGRIWDAPELHPVGGCGRPRRRPAGGPHLVDAGYRQIGFLGWPSGSPVGDDRREGWLEGLRAAGLADTTTVEESVQDLDEATCRR